MFTGLIQAVGTFSGCNMSGKAGKLRVSYRNKWTDLRLGESIAVNGVCLTLEEFSSSGLVFHVLAETFSKTDLGNLSKEDAVNLERALALGDRLGGHIVSGHVDGTAKIVSIGRQGDDTVLELSAPEALLKYIVPKGSVAVDGISLTVANIGNGTFSICIIPTTWRETNLSGRKKGELVNIETDVIGKYVCSLLERTMNTSPEQKKKEITLETLLQAGFAD